MKTFHSFFVVTATVLLLAGCGSDKKSPDESRTPVRIASDIEPTSRAFDGMNTQFRAGRAIAFWVDNAATSARLYGNNSLTADGKGGFTGGVPMYFPTTGERIDLYALHTNGSLTEAFPTSAVAHAVAADQRTEADYYDSDLLYATSKNVAKTTSAVPLTFYHLLSKVRVALVSGELSPDLAGAKVLLLGTKLTADFTPSKTADMTVREERAAMVAASGAAAAITVGNEPSPDFTAANVKYNDAVAVPQTLAAGTTFLSVELASGRTMTYELPDDMTLESGKYHIFEVTVNLPTGLTVTTRIEDWDDGGTTPVKPTNTSQL